VGLKLTLLAGGTGGTKLAYGFALLGPKVDLTIVANVADDAEIHGLHVSPDLDTLLYTLSGLVDAERGWGIRDDTLSAHAMFARLGEETWFTVGDADLATHAHRTRLLREGLSLTDATAAIAAALGVTATLLPATDDRLRTRLETDAGLLDFQDYFVRLRQEPNVTGIRLEGLADAHPTDAVLAAISDAELLVIGPSNPFVSIGPILELVREPFATASAPKVAVSPIVAGRALKGPADRMLASMGHDPTALGVARLYAGLVDRFVIDVGDAELRPQIEALGMAVDVLPAVMRSDEDRRALAAALIGTV
jgi:LPPG:FO 2-phospho-L-lactate transferase